MCNVNRHTGTGYCLMTDRLKVARAALHMWEELSLIHIPSPRD